MFLVSGFVSFSVMCDGIFRSVVPERSNAIMISAGKIDYKPAEQDLRRRQSSYPEKDRHENNEQLGDLRCNHVFQHPVQVIVYRFCADNRVNNGIEPARASF